jgi:pyrroline-5-carboxylate reductase
MMKTLGVLGCGSMASALVKGLWDPSSGLSVSCYTPSRTRAEKLAADVSGQVIESLDSLPELDSWMIGCKPQQFDELAHSLLGKIKEDAVVISIMAGIPTDRIANALGVNKVVRVMPNTPTLVGEGISLLYFTNDFSQEEKENLKELLSSASQIYSFEDEEMIEKLSGFTASGPAFVFEWARIMAAKAISYGVNEQDAYAMAKKLLFGSSKMMMESAETPEALRAQVTSKKGITYEALKVFEGRGFEEMTFEAIEAAYKRAKELAK